MVVAYQGLALEDSSQIADQLQQEGIPYELRGGGSQIAIPVNRVAETRIKIAAGVERVAPPTSIGWPQLQSRSFEVLVRCTVAFNGDYRTAAGALALAAEKAICASKDAQQLGGIARMGAHLQSTTPEKSGEGDQALYVLEQSWIVGYATRANAPDVTV